MYNAGYQVDVIDPYYQPPVEVVNVIGPPPPRRGDNALARLQPTGGCGGATQLQSARTPPRTQ